MDKKNFREYMEEHQYDIPSKLNYLAGRYPSVSWDMAQSLYKEVVIETQSIFKVRNIVDIPWGKGLLYAKYKFEQLLSLYELEKYKERINNLC